jgi:hypothetical protein
VFGIAGSSINYERKYSVPRQGKSGYFDPLFPFVLTVYQEYFWDDIMAALTEKEQAFLRVCADPETTNDVRGRIFERIVINRCRGRDLTLMPTESDDKNLSRAEFPGLLSCELVERFPKQSLPPFNTMVKPGMYVPQNQSFPAVDIIWKMKNTTWFVHVHVAKKTTNAVPTLKEMCKVAGWQGKMYFLYLSPEQRVTELLPRSFLCAENEPDIVVKALSMKSFSCLSDIPWPEGCSLDGNSK